MCQETVSLVPTRPTGLPFFGEAGDEPTSAGEPCREGPLLAGEGCPGQELLSLGGTALLLLGPWQEALRQDFRTSCVWGVGVEGSGWGDERTSLTKLEVACLLASF